MKNRLDFEDDMALRGLVSRLLQSTQGHQLLVNSQVEDLQALLQRFNGGTPGMELTTTESPPARSVAMVVGGIETAGQHPETCALLPQTGPASTGIVLHRNLVLTAKHVAKDEYDIREAVFPVDRVNVPTLDGGLRHRVQGRPIAHPQADVALLRIEGGQELSFPPAVLGGPDALLATQHTGCTMVGFGFATPDESDERGIKRASVGLVKPFLTRPVESGANGNLELVVPAQLNGICTGDSGGPLYLRSSDPPVLVGVASRRVNHVGLPSCGIDSIFVRIDRLAGWIRERARAEGITLA